MIGMTMSLSPRLLKLFIAAAVALPAAALATETPPQPQPNQRAADPALVRALQSHRWTLQSASDATGQPIDEVMVPGHAFVIGFDGARLSIQGGCNNMNGSWRLNPQRQLMVGRLAATMKACEPALMKADSALSAVLTQHLDVELQPGATPTLRLVSPTKQSLSFSGQPTLQSLYGAPTRIFLEVAAQTVPCQPGAGAPTQCIQVRERVYDDKGLRVGTPGPWRAFYDRIDGYTHQPGIRNVLRIDRFKRDRVPADASAYVYVLDMVVESEVVEKK
jgi:heat shock protein HslJ